MNAHDGTKERIAILTVHGTGDTAEGPDGEKWFQTGSDFSKRVKARLAQHGFEADILPHLWSGANSSQARGRGADKLADAVKRQAKRYSSVHIIGHSHGGNVANQAADFLRWGRKKRDRIASVTTVGTPFFKSGHDWLRTIGGWAFLAITILSTLVMLPIAVTVIVVLFQYDYTSDLQGVGAMIAAGLFAALGVGFVLAYVFMWRLALETVRRILRPRSIKKNCPAEMLSIWHPNDEAISFLQRLDGFPIEPFPKGSWSRGARMPAIQWGVNGVLLVVATGIAMGGIVLGIAARGSSGVIGQMLTELYANFGWTLLFGAIPLAPVVFYAFYLLRRFLIGLTGEYAVRNFANTQIAGVLRGMAFGRDDDERLSHVATISHTHRSLAVVLEGDVATRLQAAASKAAADLIEKYRWSLFTVGADTNGPLSALATDAMTWNSLIHTSYFDHPEVSDLIADHIAAEARKRATAGALS